MYNAEQKKQKLKVFLKKTLDALMDEGKSSKADQEFLQECRVFCVENESSTIDNFIKRLNKPTKINIIKNYYWFNLKGNFCDFLLTNKPNKNEKQLLQSALVNYTKAIKRNFYYVAAYCSRAIIYAKQKNYTAALKDCAQAIRFNPNYSQAYFNRGNILYLKQKNYDAALVDYNKVIELNPNDFLAYFNRGNIYLKQENYNAAFVDYNKAIELNPNDFRAYFCKGYIYKIQENYEAALVNYNKAIELNPNCKVAYNNKKSVYQILSKKDQDKRKSLKRPRETDDLSDEFRDNQKRQKTSNIQPPVLPILPSISPLIENAKRRQQLRQQQWQQQQQWWWQLRQQQQQQREKNQLRNPYFGR
jgi:tetratricopeptide (TPR) repeat protein